MSGEVARRPALTQRMARRRTPALADHYVRRARLMDLLDEATRAPLCLVVAPAGSGKTTLVAGWQREAPMPVAWLALDEADRDGTDLWTGVVSALDTLNPGCCADAVDALRGRARIADVVSQLVDDLAAVEGPPKALVVDDVHVLDGSAHVAPTLAMFVQNLPPWLHLILLSRRTLTLPIERLRARGHVGEVRFAELRFSDDEARDLMRRLSPDLSDERTHAAVARADGWAASLQLAALAARAGRAQLGAEPTVGPGDDLLVHDYVLREALAAERSDLVELLRDVAVVERVNAGLAQALSGRDDAAELLDEATARGLFVTRLEPGNWFEVHSLVRSVLVADSQSRSPERAREQHAIVARWSEDHGETSLALEHWQLADRPADVLRLLAERHASLYDAGLESTLVRALATIPSSTALSEVGSMAAYAWCHLLVDRRRFTELVEQVAWWAEQSELDSVLALRVALLQSMSATVNGDWLEGGRLARAAMDKFGDEHWRDPLGRFAWNGIAREVALHDRWDDAEHDVRRAELALGRDPERRIAFEGTRAVGHALSGRPLDALRVAAAVRHTAAVSNMTILRNELAVAEAIAHREIGDRTRAAAELTVLADQPAETMLYCRVLAHCELARLRVDDGDVDAAREIVHRLETLVVEESFRVGGQNWMARTGALVALANDDPAGALRWAAQVTDGFWGPISTARAHLATGSIDAAQSALDTAWARCPRHEVVLGLLQARTARNHDDAVKSAAAAVQLAAAHGMLQTVASEGPEALQLVERAPWATRSEWMDRLRRAASAGYSVGALDDRHPVNSLTERERDVLRFLPSRLTLREIAAELYVSVNTLKYHLKVIYRKLDVGSRAEAAEVARRMTALPSSSDQRSKTLAR